MASRNFVPRTNEEGSLGTVLKKWLKGWFRDLFVGESLTDGVNSVTVAQIKTASNHSIVSGDPHGTLAGETDPIFSVSEASSFVSGDKTKLDGIEVGAQVNPSIQTLPVHPGIDCPYLITSNGNGTVSIPANKASFLNDAQTSVTRYPIALNAALALTDLSVNYIVVDRNTLTWTVLLSLDAIDFIRYLPYGEIYRNGNDLHIQHYFLNGYKHVATHFDRIVKTQKYVRESGVNTISVNSSLNIACNGGKIWCAFTDYIISDITPATRQFECVLVGLEWLIVSHTNPKIDTNCFNNSVGNIQTEGFTLEVGEIYKILSRTTLDFITCGSPNNTIGTVFKASSPGVLGVGDSTLDGCGSLSPGEFGIMYLYRGVEEYDHCYTLMGLQGYASKELAQASGKLSNVPTLLDHAMFIGRIIYEYGTTSNFIIESAFVTVFAASTSITDHGSLTGLVDDDHLQYHNNARGDLLYTPIAKGVTNGDSHDHVGGDGGQIDHEQLANLKGGLAGERNHITDFQVAKLHASQGYCLYVGYIESPNVDGLTYYFGNSQTEITTTPNIRRVYIPKAGTIRVAQIFSYAMGVAGSSEAWTFNIRLNNNLNTLIQTVSLATAGRLFSNDTLNISVVFGDYIEIQMICPIWATNPTKVVSNGHIYIE